MKCLDRAGFFLKLFISHFLSDEKLTKPRLILA